MTLKAGTPLAAGYIKVMVERKSFYETPQPITLFLLLRLQHGFQAKHHILNKLYPACYP